MGYQEHLEKNLATLADPNRGRLIIVGLGENNNWRLFTGMGGRSDSSKNRYYQQLPDLNGHGDYIRTVVHDPALQQGDPSATLYIAQRSRMGWHVASNGEQTECILSVLAASSSIFSYSRNFKQDFQCAQHQYENEGEKNGYTARISAAVQISSGHAIMGKIVRQQENHEKSYKEIYLISRTRRYDLTLGEAYIIYTYNGEGGLDPDYAGPRKILLPGSLEENMDLIWNKYDPNTKAGLVGKEIDRESREPFDYSKGSDRFKYSFRSIHPNRA